MLKGSDEWIEEGAAVASAVMNWTIEHELKINIKTDQC